MLLYVIQALTLYDLPGTKWVQVHMDLFLDLAMDNPGFPVVGAHSGATPIMGAFYKKTYVKMKKLWPLGKEVP